MTGRLCAVRVGFKETRLEETEDEFGSVEVMCKFTTILLCYADDAKRGHVISIIRFLRENQRDLNNH